MELQRGADANYATTDDVNAAAAANGMSAIMVRTSKMIQGGNFQKFFGKIFGFGWGALPPRPPEFWLGGLRPPRTPP